MSRNGSPLKLDLLVKRKQNTPRHILCADRKIVKKPEILILDDSTSAVDTKTDALIRLAFEKEIPNTTKIIIAQRVASVEKADKIVVLDGGTIIACGPHERLLQESDVYREIYEEQTKSNKTEQGGIA